MFLSAIFLPAFRLRFFSPSAPLRPSPRPLRYHLSASHFACGSATLRNSVTDGSFPVRPSERLKMQATRILPDLQCSLLCEEIRQEVTGNFFLIGVINFIRVPQLPVVALKLSLFNRWTAGVGQFVESARLIAPDQTTVLRKGEVKFTLQDAALHATNVTLFGQVEFKVAGTYYIEVLVDDVMKLRYPVPVIVTPPQSQPPGSQTPPAPATGG